MSSFKITGKASLSGKILVSGAKNSALKILPAAILADSPSLISNVPDIIDISKMLKILESIGATITYENGRVNINPTTVNSEHPDDKLVKKLRGSIVLIGPLLSRFGHAIFSEPGGCLIGTRSIDDHLDLFEQLGVKSVYKNGCYYLKGYPKAGKVVLNKMSVTATENAILATVLSKGETTIDVAAAEPEIIDLANYLNKMGAKVTGAGTHTIKVEGVKKLSGTVYNIMPDRIEAGTFLLMALSANSEMLIGPVFPETLNLVTKKLFDMGAKVKIVSRDKQFYFETIKHKSLLAQNIDTRPYPGFPTDLQSPFAVLATQAVGETKIFETMFEGRFAYLEELRLLRAKTEVLNPHEFKIDGPTNLKGTTISSKDIRGGAALVLAALIAEGTTIIEDIEFIDRGYEKIDEKLQGIGAKIERIQ